MRKINRLIEYSLMALRHMSLKNEQGNTTAEKGKTTAKEVSECYGTPFDATSRALQKMTQAGLLKSEPGIGGGYILLQSLSEVYLSDLIQWVDGPIELTKCFRQNSTCELVHQCNIINPITLLNQRIETLFESLSIQELLFTNPLPSPLNKKRLPLSKRTFSNKIKSSKATT